MIHYVSKSASLRYNHHNWIPICMPDFNPNGFLQAYVSDFIVSSQYQQQQHDYSGELSSSSSSSSSSSKNNNNNNNNNKSNNHDDNNGSSTTHYIKMQNTKENIMNDEVVELTVILVASSADPEVFRELLQGKAIVEYVS